MKGSKITFQLELDHAALERRQKTRRGSQYATTTLHRAFLLLTCLAYGEEHEWDRADLITLIDLALSKAAYQRAVEEASDQIERDYMRDATGF
jgi:hypothetical protein